MTDVTAVNSLPALPFEQHSPLAVAPLLHALQAERPITRVRTPAGDEAWLVTRYAEVRALLSDPRLGRSHPDPEHAPRITDSILFGEPMERYETEQADHAQMRALLTPYFSVRRMQALRPRVEALVDQLLDALAARTPPVDLHEALSFPLPVLVICELLGVPYHDREQFRTWSTAMAELHDRERAQAALYNLVAYMGELVARKRACPADDLLSGLCAAEGGRLLDMQIAFLGAMVLFAGHETTVVRIDVGTLLLLTNAEQREALAEHPELVASAIEEVLRLSVLDSGSGGLPRYAHADIEIGGLTIRAGEAVLLSRGAANHDERIFADPDRFDVRRQPNAHLTFGYGPRFCLGAPLARVELQAVVARLVRRFPTLRLAVPLEELHVHSELMTGGFFALPVTW
jgi:pentalenolactone synthase